MSERMTDDRILGYERIWNTLGSREKELLQALKAERQHAGLLNDSRLGAEDRIAELEAVCSEENEGNIELNKYIAELEERLRVEQSCNRCKQYHGKDACDDIAELEALLREHLNPPSEIDAFQWHDEYLNRCREALGDKV